MKSVFTKSELGVVNSGMVVLLIDDVNVDLAINSRKELGRQGSTDYELTDEELDTSLVSEQELRGQAFLQAPMVRKVPDASKPDGTRWEAVFGVRRVLRCKKSLPGSMQRFRFYDSKHESPEAEVYDVMAMNLKENVQRQGLRPWELAEHLYNMKQTSKKIPADIAKDVGMHRKFTGNLIRIREKASDEVWELYKSAGESIPFNRMGEIVMLPKPEQVAAFKKLEAAGFIADGDEDEEGKKGKGKNKDKGAVPCLGGQKIDSIYRRVKRYGIKSMVDDTVRTKGDPFFEGFIAAMRIALKIEVFVLPEDEESEEAAE